MTRVITSHGGIVPNDRAFYTPPITMVVSLMRRGELPDCLTKKNIGVVGDIRMDTDNLHNIDSQCVMHSPLSPRNKSSLNRKA